MIYLIHNSKAYSILELAASFIIIFILIGGFGIFASKVLTNAREVALRNELYNLRLSLELYRVHNRADPEELASLYSVKEYFVLINRFDRERRLLDPFGNKYYYNSKTGIIKSSTTRYKGW